MRRIFFLITLFIFLPTNFITPAGAQELVKVMSLSYDNTSSMVVVSTTEASDGTTVLPIQKYVRLSQPNRIYFDINNAVLIGGKQHLLFEKSVIKEIKLAQFDTNPYTVRLVITFEEDFDTSKVKLYTIGKNVIVKISKPELRNDYFSRIYDDSAEQLCYSSLGVFTQAVKRAEIPASVNDEKAVINDIQQAFADSTLPNTDGKTYDEVYKIDLSSGIKLRTKYYINQYEVKNGGLLVSGIGQISTAKIFYLNSPKRLVLDLPNTYLNRNIRNKELNLCADSSGLDTAKIGQFEFNKARIVITSDNASKYIPIYSQDSQSLFLINTDKLDHTALSSVVSNINKVYVQKLSPKTTELILSFTEPIVHTLVRSDNALNLYLFNVKSYNETDIIKTLNNTIYKRFTFSLLPKIGVKGSIDLNRDDVVAVDESVDARALKITITRNTKEEIRNSEKPAKRSKNKNKVVLDAGHGGSDYGAIRAGINEKDITLDITQRVESLLKAKGYKVFLTRKEDVFVSLEDRVNFSELEDPEIFVSIHVNSAVSSTPCGIETHWYHEYSTELAEVIHKHLLKEIPSANDRGLFKSKFYVINHTTVPAVLCEIGFISNDEERADIITEERKQKTAKAIADGIIEYLKSGGK